MDRRALLRAVLVLGGGSVMPELGTGGGFDVATEGARTAELKAAYRRGVPGALIALETHADNLFDGFQEHSHRESGRKRAHLFADAAQYIAHIHYKGASYAQGIWWADRAAHVADSMDDARMVALAVCRKSVIRAAEGQIGHAVAMAEMARSKDGSPFVKAESEVHIACAAGKGTSSHDRYQALAALERAEVAIDKGKADGDPDMAGLSVEGLAYHRGSVLVASKPKLAEDVFVKFLDVLPEERRLTRASVLIRRAMVQADLREYEQAVSLAAEGLAIATEGGVRRDVWRVMRLRNQLGETAPARLVAELDEALQPQRDIRGSVLWRQDHR
jgi:hypothetical protein